MATKENKTTNINVSDISETVGSADELPARDRARLVMAYVILGGVFALFLIAAGALFCVAQEKLNRAQMFFDFVKGFGPPLVTLVLGFYFRDAAEVSSE